MAHVYLIDDEGVYGDELVDAFDPWREAERELDRPPVLTPDECARAVALNVPGVRLVDGVPHYSAAWLDARAGL